MIGSNMQYINVVLKKNPINDYIIDESKLLITENGDVPLILAYCTKFWSLIVAMAI